MTHDASGSVSDSIPPLPPPLPPLQNLETLPTIGCVYMPTDGSGIATIDDSYNLLKEDVLTFKQKGKVVLLGDFNARVGRSSEVDDVIGMFGEETCNASGNKLISFLNEVELVACNGRKLVVEPEWTRVRPSLKQKSIIDYIITDGDSRKASGDVHVDSSDIGCSDHFLVWMELGRACKLTKSRRRIIKKWCLDRFEVEDVRFSYQEALGKEVKGFSESIRQKMSKGLKGHALVGEVLREWESIVNRVAKREVGEKMIVCGKSARWWDSEVKDKINSRRQLYKSMLDGNVDAWEDYCKLRKEVKDLIRKKKIDIWNEIVENVNTDYEESRKEFWAFVGRRTKSKKKAIGSLRSDKGYRLVAPGVSYKFYKSIMRLWVGSARIVILMVNGKRKLKLK